MIGIMLYQLHERDMTDDELQERMDDVCDLIEDSIGTNNAGGEDLYAEQEDLQLEMKRRGM